MPEVLLIMYEFFRVCFCLTAVSQSPIYVFSEGSQSQTAKSQSQASKSQSQATKSHSVFSKGLLS